MEIRNLITFLKVAELKNFTHAGNEIGYVQSTITAQIQQLEDELGDKLFDRLGKKIVITKTGEKLLPYANKILALSEEAKNLTKDDNNIKETLRIGIVHSLYISKLVHIIPLFKKSFPLVTISITLSSGIELIENLMKNKLDIIFIIDKEIIDTNVINIFQQSEEMVFVASSQNLLCKEKNLTLEKILENPVILSEHQGIYYNILKKIAAKKSLNLNSSIEINDVRAIIDLVKLDLGISFLPKYVVDHFLEFDEISILDINEAHKFKLYSQIFYHKDKWLSRSMRGFINSANLYFKNN